VIANFDADLLSGFLANDTISGYYLEESRYVEADLIAYEQQFQVALPEAYRWVRLNYPGLRLSPRDTEREGVIDGPQLGVVYPLAREPSDGFEGLLDAEREGLGPEIIEWERKLRSHSFCENGPESEITFDFAFDATNPPIVAIDTAAGVTMWRKEVENVHRRGGRIPLQVRMLEFVADSFVDLIVLPLEEGGDGRAPAVQQREEEWVEWRNERLLRFIDDS